MGTVYEALDTGLGRHVALKLIVEHHAADPEFRVRFVREAQAQASLDSPHVVQVFAHGEIDGRLYIASQLVLDGDLGSALRHHGPLPVAEAVDLVAQVADGLAEAHRAGLVHRDIKASNVLLRRRGTHTSAYLADFGIAASTRDDVAQVAADVHALGRLLWSCLTAQPYDATWLPKATRPVEEVLRRALAGGFGSAREFSTALKQTQSRRQRPSRYPSRRSVRTVVAAAALAVVVGTGLAWGIALARTRASDVAGGPERERPADPPADLVRQLEQDAGLDPATAACAARALERDDLTAAAGCLWAD